MKATTYACLESMMFEALNELKSAHEELVCTHIVMMNKRDDDELAKNYSKARQRYDDASIRYSDLLTTQKIIKEMESKGIEI